MKQNFFNRLIVKEILQMKSIMHGGIALEKIMILKEMNKDIGDWIFKPERFF